MPKGKGVMTEYPFTQNSLVYPKCEYADNSHHYDSKEIRCLKSPVERYCSVLNEKGECPLDLEEHIKLHNDMGVMGFCQSPGGVPQCIAVQGNKYKTCGECPDFITADEKQKQEFYQDNPEFLEL
jgi:hypothetical protein